ncbi:sulfur carrier protein [Gemmobacter aquatilis]|uniref:Sulfur carrier protein n=1 Tax=Gemmobacter aquatilis TaxID=933059 RepID=A0A1H7Y7D4_9RHOB|nr:sulfur carrier protein ThiS [Gemmobacter aquatilis]SEM42136.1 sulfur carrier protein [Gemmobacter aquatilis]
MQIDLNGTRYDIGAASLAEVLAELGYGGAAVATAVNGAFIPASARPTTPVQEGDRIEVLAPMQGG